MTECAPDVKMADQCQSAMSERFVEGPMLQDIWCLIWELATTLPETNIAPENGPSQKETSLAIIHF